MRNKCGFLVTLRARVASLILLVSLMRKFLPIPLLLLSVYAQAQSPTVAIRAVTVVDVTDGSLDADFTVLIRGKRIVAVGPADEVTIPDDAAVVDGAGGYLIPGLWDMHVHSVANVALDMAVNSVEQWIGTFRCSLPGASPAFET